MLTHIMGSYGIGVAVAGAGDSLRFSHGGANAGYRSNFVAFARSGAGIVVMTNSDNGAAVAQEMDLRAATAAIAAGDREIALSAQVHAVPFYRAHGFVEEGGEYEEAGIAHQVITPIALAPATLDEYTGTYHVADVELTVTRDGDRLMLAQDDGEPLELVPTATDTFVYLGGGITVEFERDERGEVVALLAVNTRAERAR